MASEKRVIGPTSRRIMENLRHLRRQQGLTSYELADRMKERGWPLAQSGIVRCESGQRAVNVDDLIAFAVALGCSPNRLLMPAPIVPLQVEVEVLPDVRRSLGATWAWATGEMPLTPTTPHDEAEFVLANRPHRFASVLGAETADLLSGSRGARSPDDIVTPDELAAELKVERDMIDVWRASGRGPRGFVIEGSLRFRRGEITRWLASCGDASAG